MARAYQQKKTSTKILEGVTAGLLLTRKALERRWRAFLEALRSRSRRRHDAARISACREEYLVQRLSHVGR